MLYNRRFIQCKFICVLDQVITVEPSHVISDDDEECEEDIEGTLITMETTLSLEAVSILPDISIKFMPFVSWMC